MKTMLRTLLSVALLCSTLSTAYGQGFVSALFAPKAHNEVRLNLLMPLTANTIQADYEYLFKSDLGAGAAVAWSFADQDLSSLHYGVSPFVRWYFSGNSQSTSKYAAGLYVEANTTLAAYRGALKNVDGKTERESGEDSFGFGLGFGLGWKYVSANDWVADLGFRLSRRLGNPDNSPAMQGMFMLSIGRRF